MSPSAQPLTSVPKTSSQAPVRQLLVDLDGTLLANHAFTLSVDFARQAVAAMSRYTGGTRKAISTLLAIRKEFESPSSRSLANDVRVVTLVAERLTVTAEEARQILRENLSSIFPALERHFYPVAGSKDFLEWAKDRYPLVLATNPVWPPEIIELRVRWAGIDPTIFRSITHVRRMNACKPKSAYYQQILEQEGFKAEECLLVGDNMKMDLPATQVGIRVFIVGKFKATTPLKYPKAQAQAWRGTYAGLRSMLESGQESSINQSN